MTDTKDYKLICRRVSNQTFLAAIALIIIISAGIARYSINILLTVNAKKHHSSDRLEDISSKLQIEADSNTQTYTVLEALIQDGYNPTTLSAMICSRSVAAARIKQVNNVIQSKSGILCSNSKLVPPAADLIVPNVVHYVLTGPNKTFHFISYLSFLSVERFIKPEQIFVHGDQPPSDYWWNVTMHQVRNIYFVKRSYMDTAPNGIRFRFPAHSSDYLRAEILSRYGGIYLDPDVIVLKSFDPLRKYPMVLGRETTTGICNGIIIAQREAIFIRLMLEQYRSYKGSKEGWAEKSVINSHVLAQLYPHLVHVEEKSLNRPNWQEKKLIYDGHYNWTGNYAMHLWIRLWPPGKRPSGPEDVWNKSTTLGAISRLILLGSPNIY